MVDTVKVSFRKTLFLFTQMSFHRLIPTFLCDLEHDSLELLVFVKKLAVKVAL